MRAILVVLGLGVAGASLTAAPAGVRNLYLNGVDISSAKSQELKNVDVTINERGDIFIIAPHYQVHEEDSYVPLSKYVQNMSAPQHKAPQPVAAGTPAGARLEPAMAVKVPAGSNPGAPESQQPKSPTSDAKDTPAAGEDGLAAKAGDKVGDAGSPPPVVEKKPDEPKQEDAGE
jgi:hypothetical protein